MEVVLSAVCTLPLAGRVSCSEQDTAEGRNEIQMLIFQLKTGRLSIVTGRDLSQISGGAERGGQVGRGLS